LALSAHCCRSRPPQDAAVRPVEAAIRAERSILSTGTSVSGQTGPVQMQLLLTQHCCEPLPYDTLSQTLNFL